MSYCKNCGSETSDYQDVCLKCGTSLKSSSSYVVDNGGFGWGLLGFCIPVAGLVLFLVWKEERPITGKAAGVGALVGVILQIVFYIIYMIVLIGLRPSIYS